MKRARPVWCDCYTTGMGTVVLVLVAVIVVLVAIDGIARWGPRALASRRDPTGSSTKRIIVDLTKRR